MKSNYKRLGDYIQELKVRNTEEKAEQLLGININKFFMPSVANVVGTDLYVYMHIPVINFTGICSFRFILIFETYSNISVWFGPLIWETCRYAFYKFKKNN